MVHFPGLEPIWLSDRHLGTYLYESATFVEAFRVKIMGGLLFLDVDEIPGLRLADGEASDGGEV